MSTLSSVSTASSPSTVRPLGPVGAVRVGVVLDYQAPFEESVADVRALERLGIDLVTVAEAYSFDAVSQLGYLAAITSTVALSTGVLGLFSRTPTMLAMTAAGLDAVSGGRFELGLGASAPRVVEGWHGVPYDAPLQRLRETVQICRTVWRREPLEHPGPRHPLPLPARDGAPGKPLHLISRPVRADVPVVLAGLGPGTVALAAEVAHGWLPLFFLPERARQVWGAALEAGSARRDPQLPPLDVIAQVPTAVGEHTGRALAAHRERVALYVGGMGERGRNSYQDLARRYGFADAAARVQELYLAGRREEAAAAVPEELVRGTCLIGTAREVAERVGVLLGAGVGTLSLQLVGATRDERVDAVAAVQEALAVQLALAVQRALAAGGRGSARVASGGGRS